MTTSDEIKEIFQKLAQGTETVKDIEVLRQAHESDERITFQFGKQIVNIGQGTDIHFGDQIIQENFDTEAIRKIIRLVLEENSEYLQIQGKTSRALGAVFAQQPQDLAELPKILIGREKILVRVRSALERNEQVLLQGFAGIGKTALAATVASGWITDGKGSTIWLKAGKAEADSLFEAIAYLLGKQQELIGFSGDARLKYVRDLLAKTKALFILDDVLNGSALRMVLKALPADIPLLITSRQRFPVETIIEVEQLNPAKAVELLGYYAGQDLSSDSDADNLAKELGYHPFALEIASKTMQVDRINPSQLLQRILNAPHNLAMPEDFASEGRESVKRLLDASVEALDKSTREVFLAMGAMFGSSVTPELLALFIHCRYNSGLMSLWAEFRGFKFDEGDIDSALISLERRGLAKRFEQTNNSVTYYRIHDLAYSYVHAQASKDIRNTALEACLEYIQKYRESTPTNYAQLLPVLENFIDAAAWALEVRRYDDVAKFSDVLTFEKILDDCGLYLFEIELLKLAIQADVSARKKDKQAAHLGYLGAAYTRMNQRTQAIESFEKSIQINRQLQNKSGLGVQLGNLGASYISFGDYEQAKDYIQKSLKIAKKLGNSSQKAINLGNLGVIYENQGDYPRAIQHYEKSNKLQELLGDQRGMVINFSNLAAIYQITKQFDKAIEFYELAISISSQKGYRNDEAGNLSRLGGVYTDLEDYQNATKCFIRALEIRRDLGNSQAIMEALGELGSSYYNMALYSQAIKCYKEALEIARKNNNQENEVLWLANLGDAYMSLGQYDQAVERYQKAISIARTLSDKANEALWLSNLGIVYSNLGDIDQAISYSNQALKIARELNDKSAEASYLSNLGFVCAKLDRAEEAITYSQAAIDIAREEGNRVNEAIYLSNLGLAYLNLGRSAQAIESYNQALSLLDENRDRTNRMNWRSQLAWVHARQGQNRLAVDLTRQSLILARDLNHRTSEANLLGSLANLQQLLGQYEDAIVSYQEALAIAREIQNEQLEANQLNNLGSTYKDLGIIHLALEQTEQALAIARKVRDRSIEASSLGQIGNIHSDLGHIKQGIDFCKKALDIFHVLKDISSEGFCLANLGGAYSNLGKYDQALEYLDRAHSVANKIGDIRLKIYTFLMLGEIKLSQSQYEEAEEMFLRASRVTNDIQEPRLKYFVASNLCVIQLYTDRLTLALSNIISTRQYTDVTVRTQAAVLHGVVLTRIGQSDEALVAFREALTYADNLLAKTPEYYLVKYSYGLALSGLALLSTSNEQTMLIAQAISSYSQAQANCGAAGVVRSALQMLDQLRLCDSTGILDSVHF